MHGAMQVIGRMTKKTRVKLLHAMHVPTDTAWYRFFQQAVVFALVCASYVFFRSSTFAQAGYIFTHWFRGWGIFAHPMQAIGSFISLADSVRVTAILILSSAALWLLECYERKRKQPFDQMVAELSLPVQWCVYYGMLFAIALFGAFGQSSFIYFQF